jgi:hypothetical protein
LRNLGPKTPIQLYERQTPGDLIHIEVKKLARFRKVGHRITGNRQEGRSTGVGMTGFTWLLMTPRGGLRGGARRRAAGHSDRLYDPCCGLVQRQGIECRRLLMSERPAYVSRSFGKACRALGLKHIRTRPYTPRTNGNAERFIQTLYREWAYGMAFKNSCERNQWLPRDLSIYNSLRKHTALGGRSPQQRLNELLC